MSALLPKAAATVANRRGS